MNAPQGRVVRVEYGEQYYVYQGLSKKYPAETSPPHKVEIYISCDGDNAYDGGLEGLFLVDEKIETDEQAMEFFKRHGHAMLGSEVSISVSMECMITKHFFTLPLTEFCRLILECRKETQHAPEEK